MLHLPQLDCSCLPDWTFKMFTNQSPQLFFVCGYFHCLSPSRRMRLLGDLVKRLFFMPNSLSGTLFLAKLGHWMHSHLTDHLWNMTCSGSGYPADCVCVCVCELVLINYVLTFFLFFVISYGLCAAIWRNSTHIYIYNRIHYYYY